MTPPFRAVLVLAAFTAPLAACPGGTQGFPFISDINGAYQAEGPIGSTVIAEGIQFGDVQGNSQLLFTNSLGAELLPATVTMWNNTFIVATVPTGASSGPVGVNNGNGLNQTIQFFTIRPLGPFTPSAITSWTAAPALPATLSGHSTAFMTLGPSTAPVRVAYVTGGEGAGGTPVNTVYYATTPASGQIGPWAATTGLTVPLAFHASVVATRGNSADTAKSGGHLLIVGGATDSLGSPSAAVYRLTINADGSIQAGTWAQVSTLPQPLRSMGATIFMGHLYVVGGATTGNAPVATVYRAVIQPDASIKNGDWTSLGSLPAPRARFGFGQFNGNLYVIGGDAAAHSPNDTTVAGSTTIYRGAIDLYSRGITSWAVNGTSLPTARSAESVVIGGVPGTGSVLVSGGLYTGSSDELYAPINADGSIGTLTALGSSLPTAVYNQAATGIVDGNGNFHALITGGASRAAPATRHAETYTNAP